MPEVVAGKAGSVTAVAPVLSEDQIASKVTGFAIEGEGEVSLNDARVIVSGGRGVGGPDGFKPVAELAKTLGGALGASRALPSMRAGFRTRIKWARLARPLRPICTSRAASAARFSIKPVCVLPK
ncbi:MAG: FAD-binding protein [Anaerolineae bacterium]